MQNVRIGTVVVALLVACSDATTENSLLGPEPGAEPKTQILLTDAPFPYGDVASVEIHIVRVAVSTTADTGSSADSQQWTTVAEPRRRLTLSDMPESDRCGRIQGSRCLLAQSLPPR